MFLNTKLEVLGCEGIKVLDKMREEGISEEVIEPLLLVAKKAAGKEDVDAMEDVNDVEVKKFRRCKWWNGGFCREKKNCSFSHPLEDCENHLKGGCTTKGCKTKRHRKQCKYFNTESGCHRGESCEYLHQHEILTEEKEVKDKEENEVHKRVSR